MDPTQTQPCLRCGAQMALTEQSCVSCGTTLAVELRLLGPPSDARTRFELARRLSAIPGVRGDLATQLRAKTPVIASRITRAGAMTIGRVLSDAGIEFDVLPLAIESGKGSRTVPVSAVVGVAIALAVAGAIWLALSRPRATVDAAAPAPAEPPAASSDEPNAREDVPPPRARAGPSLKVAMRSVVSVRCGKSRGSGFFVAKNTVVTNHHVVCPAPETPTVVLSSGLEAKATVVRQDAKHDLAVLSVTADAAPLELGDAASAEVGSPVSIIGSPQGLDFTVQRATLAFVGRATGGVGYLQIDGAVNPGNSGGPLLDEQGKVIGIVTARLQNADGIGFAVPANYLVAGESPVWPGGAPRLLSSAWRSFAAEAQKSGGPGLGTSAARPGTFEAFDHLLITAAWRRTRSERPTEVGVIVVSTDPSPEERRWTFQLMFQDEVLCDMLPTKTLAWVRLESNDPNLPPELARQLAELNRERQLYVGVMALGWGRCPGASSHHPAELALELPIAAPGSRRSGILLRNDER